MLVCLLELEYCWKEIAQEAPFFLKKLDVYKWTCDEDAEKASRPHEFSTWLCQHQHLQQAATCSIASQVVQLALRSC